MSEETFVCKCGFEGYTKYYYGICPLCYKCFVNIIEKELIREFMEDLERFWGYTNLVNNVCRILKEKWEAKKDE